MLLDIGDVDEAIRQLNAVVQRDPITRSRCAPQKFLLSQMLCSRSDIL
jgi:hypothetical protein